MCFIFERIIRRICFTNFLKANSESCKMNPFLQRFSTTISSLKLTYLNNNTFLNKYNKSNLNTHIYRIAQKISITSKFYFKKKNRPTAKLLTPVHRITQKSFFFFSAALVNFNMKSFHGTKNIKTIPQFNPRKL